MTSTWQTASLGERVERSSGAAASSVLLALASIAYLVVAPFPSTYSAARPGLDSSWVWAINWVADSKFRFGRDVVFPYGPLGYLLYPANVGNHVLAAILFRWAVAILGALALLGLAPGRTARLAVFALFNAIALGLGQYYDFHLLVLAALGGLLAVERRSAIALLVLAVCTAPLALIKFTTGFGGWTVLLVAAGLFARRGMVAHAGAAVGVHAFAAAALTTALTGSPANALRWLRGSCEIAAGYSAAMSLDPGWHDHWLGVLMLACYAGAAIALWRLRPGSAAGLALLAGPLFVAFKSGFVREDAHVISFYSFTVAASAMAVLGAEGRRQQILAFGCIGVMTCLALSGLGFRDYLDKDHFIRAASGLRGARGIAASFQSEATKLQLDRVASVALPGDRLPQDVRTAVGTATVLVAPWEYAYCPANQLSCVPQPALQSYAAYTPWLDRVSADLLEDRDAPEFVLVDSVASIDGRNLVLDGPLWWRSLTRWYDLVVLPSRLPLLLRRRAAPHDRSTLDAGSARLRVGEWVSLPDARGPLFAELRLRPNLRGLLARALLRIPEVLLDLRFASGDSRTFRILPDTAVNGMPISAAASDLTDLRDILEGRSARQPVALRVRGSGTRFYHDAADIHFSEIRP